MVFPSSQRSIQSCTAGQLHNSNEVGRTKTKDLSSYFLERGKCSTYSQKAQFCLLCPLCLLVAKVSKNPEMSCLSVSAFSKRSPNLSSRLKIVLIVNSAGSIFRFSSSHFKGVETGAPARGRGE